MEYLRRIREVIQNTIRNEEIRKEMVIRPAEKGIVDKKLKYSDT